jgi:hypothetical protein
VFEIKITQEEVQIILSGLGKLPAEISFNTIMKINGQVQKQLEEERKCKKEKKPVKSAKEISKS